MRLRIRLLCNRWYESQQYAYCPGISSDSPLDNAHGWPFAQYAQIAANGASLEFSELLEVQHNLRWLGQIMPSGWMPEILPGHGWMCFVLILPNRCVRNR